MSRRYPNSYAGPGGFRARQLGQAVPGENGTTAVMDSWVKRLTMADVYPRATDPAKPPATVDPNCIPCAPGTRSIFDLFKITTPGPRPVVYQKAVNMQITVPASPGVIPITNNRFECDSFVIDTPSTALQSVFFGFGSSVSTTSGLEIQPGLPVLIEPENTREMWEIQRQLEYIAALLAMQQNLPVLGTYRAPRVVFNTSDWWLTATAATVISVMLFSVPELQ